MLSTESLLLLRSIALTGENGLYLAGGAIAGFLLCLSIIIGVFAAVYMPEKDDN